MSHLITTKFMIPRPPTRLVERPALLERLAVASDTRLLLASAPAGAGKSTLLGQWIERQGRPAAWLSLEPGENDLHAFLLYLFGAVQRIHPPLGRALLEQVEMANGVDARAAITQLVNGLSELAAPCVLVLDDYHVITEGAIHDATEFLLEHLPPQVCLAVSTRSDPPFALGRLRLRGQMIEVRGDALRFGIAEAEALLNDGFALGLSPEAVASLEDRTEGWIAGLQLAALSLAGRQDREAFVAGFAGSHRHLVDYLLDEVLRDRTPEMQRFLQRTSVLGRFTRGLCEAVVGVPVAAETLRRLEADNLFLIPLDDEREWYRYHHLFAEFLLHRLRETEPDALPELHGRASRWLERHGWTDEAIRHALRADDPQRAATLVEGVAFRLGVTWNNAQLLRYVETIPSSLLPQHPRLCIYYTWALTNTGRLTALEGVLPLLEASESHAEQPHTVRACLLTMQAYARLRALDFAGSVTLCRSAMAELEPVPEAPSDEERWLVVAAGNLMVYGMLHSDLGSADRLYPEALARSERFGNFIGTINGFARWGSVRRRLGQLRASRDILEQGLDTLERWRRDRGADRVVNVSELHLALAGLDYEWDRLADCEQRLRCARTMNELAQFPPALALEGGLAFRLALVRDGTDDARSVLGRLDGLGEATPSDNRLYRQIFEVTAMELRLLLASSLDDAGGAAVEERRALLDGVADWAARRGLDPTDPFDHAREGHYAILARLLVLRRRAGEAQPLLARLAERAEEESRNGDLLRYLLLQALAAEDPERAAPPLERALALAEPEGYRRSFLDLGPPLRARLLHLAEMRPTPYLTALLRAFAADGPPGGRSRRPPGGGVGDEPALTERQREVLRLLAQGHSNKEIAKRLALTPNTVKWYLRNLFESLGVDTRVKAVNRARELGLAP